jgi:hypothetical protein
MICSSQSQARQFNHLDPQLTTRACHAVRTGVGVNSMAAADNNGPRSACCDLLDTCGDPWSNWQEYAGILRWFPRFSQYVVHIACLVRLAHAAGILLATDECECEKLLLVLNASRDTWILYSFIFRYLEASKQMHNIQPDFASGSSKHCVGRGVPPECLRDFSDRRCNILQMVTVYFSIGTWLKYIIIYQRYTSTLYIPIIHVWCMMCDVWVFKSLGNGQFSSVFTSLTRYCDSSCSSDVFLTRLTKALTWGAPTSPLALG